MSKRKNNYTNYSKYSEEKPIDISEEKTEEPEIQEEVEDTDSKIPQEVKNEKVPQTGDLVSNLYIRETPYGDKMPKDELDRILSSKVISDCHGNAIVPKGTRVEVYDVTVVEDGSVWYNTRFGYLMAKNKSGERYIDLYE